MTLPGTAGGGLPATAGGVPVHDGDDGKSLGTAGLNTLGLLAGAVSSAFNFFACVRGNGRGFGMPTQTETDFTLSHSQAIFPTTDVENGTITACPLLGVCVQELVQVFRSSWYQLPAARTHALRVWIGWSGVWGQ